MQPFTIDHQTFRDLNVLTDDQHSVFSLFKHTRTLGGRERLKQMMQNPSNDVNALIHRRDSIAYFSSRKLEFEIRNEELDLIEFYLKFDKRKSKSNLIDSVADYLTKNSSNDYYIIKTGLKYLIKLSKYLTKFINANLTVDTPAYLVIAFEQIRKIIDEGPLAKAIKLDEHKLKFYQVNKLDSLFRGQEKERMHALLHYVYELDIFENLALLKAKHNFSFPVYDESEQLSVSLLGLFHPAIANPVHNDVMISKDQNIVFLSGSNMAGKSSLLKSIGLAIYLAHLGFPVPAKSMNTTVFNGLISTINLPDDINGGLSHYYSEVRRVKDVATRLTEQNKMFVIFDELFRGTNVIDAFDASLLIISELSAIKDSVFFVSTHIVELADELQKIENISFSYMETFLENDQPVFTYKLAKGISKERLGMFIVLNEGIVEIIKRAANNS